MTRSAPRHPQQLGDQIARIETQRGCYVEKLDEVDPALPGLQVRHERLVTPEFLGQLALLEPGLLWDEDSVLAGVVATCGPEIGREARRLVDWMRSNADRLQFNTHVTYGTLSPQFERGGSRPFYPFQIATDGMFGIYFQYMAGRPVFDDMAMRRELLIRLNGIAGFDLPESALTKRPLLKLALFTQPGVTNAFLGVMDWFVAQLPARGAAVG